MINSKKRFCERLPNVKSCCIGVNFTSGGELEYDLDFSFMDLTSYIKQGTGRHQRIGDKIKLLKAHVKIYYNVKDNWFSGEYDYAAIRHGLVKTKFHQNVRNHSEFLRSSDFGIVSYMEAYYDDAKVEVFKDSLSTLCNDFDLWNYSNFSYKIYDYVKDINEIICYFDKDKPNKQLVLSDFYEYCRDPYYGSINVHRYGNITLYFIDV